MQPPSSTSGSMPTSVARRELSLLLLRLVVGFGFAAHGYAKLARGPGQFAAILTALHIPAPSIAAWATALLEFGGGVAVMAGALVPFVALPLGVILLTALVTVHLHYGFSSVRLTGVTPDGATFGPVGYELDLLYLAALITVAMAGPGPLALDRWIFPRRSAAGRAS